VGSELVTLGQRYALEDRIASGGMATVWRARDDVLARTVAIKLLHPHLAEDSEFLERFRREALAAARLSHSNIVAIFDTGTEATEGDGSGDDVSERHFIVMEYCSGGTLATALANEGPFDPGRAASVAAEVCDALGYAHRSGIVHRDVKPHNVLITEEGSLKVADFGIAKAAFGTSDITTTGSILGTVTYLSPEQVQGLEPDARSDLYSLGVVVYELLAGRPPFVEDTQIAVAMAHAHRDPPPLRSIRARIPRALEAIVMKSLAKDPDERWQSAEEMMNALRQTGGQASTAIFPRPVTDPVPVSDPVPQAGGQAARPARSQALTQTRNLVPVLLLVGIALILGLVLPRLLDDDSPASANGDSGAEGTPGPTGASPLRIASARDFDPLGDGEEHSEDVPLAFDGDGSTFWTTETYSGSLGKPGVGLLFDLGTTRSVDEVRIASDTPGFSLELRAGDRPAEGVGALAEVASSAADEATSSLQFEPSSARYWLLWITELPAGGGSAHIAEVEFLGS
jgi:eukaryotic-like serine/threonine-protein kinase